MKKLFLLILGFIAFNDLFAGHVNGGEIYYTYIGPGATAGTDRYRITLRLFRECNPPVNPDGSTPAQLPGSVEMSIFNNADDSRFLDVTVNADAPISVLQLSSPSPCIINPPDICYQYRTYTFTQDLPVNTSGYTVAYQTCCRRNNLVNVVQNGPNGNSPGATYIAQIPGTNTLPVSAGHNTSAVFDLKDTVIICAHNYFTLDFSASDADGDSLSYQFCAAYDGGTSNSSTNVPVDDNTYNPVDYTAGFSGTAPLGVSVNIGATNGIIAGVAPDVGPYVVSVCVTEWRNGIPIDIHRKDFIVRVNDCNPLKAQLNPNYEFCDDFLVTFQNNASNPGGTTYFWDFGVPGITTDTATSFASDGLISYQYLDTGTYTIKLKVTLNGVCTDSTTAVAAVYPGFFPGFRWIPACKGTPFQFIDTSKTRYGSVSEWRWDFGDPGTLADTSHLQNPQYTYANSGTYTVILQVATNKGCHKADTAQVTVIDKPTITSTNDTLICDIDDLPLFSQASVNGGSYTWTSSPIPNYNFVTSPNIQNPVVSPNLPTTYYVDYNAGAGCTARDSVFVDVKTFVTLEAGPDTTICLTDTIRARPSSDALSYQWTSTPPSVITTAGIKFPVIQPLNSGTTWIKVIANIGLCQARDSFRIVSVPYPTAIAGPKSTICAGDSVQLTVTAGDRYVWSPSRGLNNPRIQTPIAKPNISTDYVVSVFQSLGCPKPGKDTVPITVIPPVIPSVTNDTTVVIGQPLQLFAAGANNATWTASSTPTWLNDPNILNPLAIIRNDIGSIMYYVRIYTDEGCEAFDSVRVKIYRTKPDLFVPSVFTPNLDGKNDVFRPIPIGIRKLNFFRVFNRNGKLMYSTEVLQQGWDGTYNGQDQNQGTFVWEAQAETYEGTRIYKKGYVVLLR